jgi:hypothetical protein
MNVTEHVDDLALCVVKERVVPFGVGSRRSGGPRGWWRGTPLRLFCWPLRTNTQASCPVGSFGVTVDSKGTAGAPCHTYTISRRRVPPKLSQLARYFSFLDLDWFEIPCALAPTLIGIALAGHDAQLNRLIRRGPVRR